MIENFLINYLFWIENNFYLFMFINLVSFIGCVIFFKEFLKKRRKND